MQWFIFLPPSSKLGSWTVRSIDSPITNTPVVYGLTADLWGFGVYPSPCCVKSFWYNQYIQWKMGYVCFVSLWSLCVSVLHNVSAASHYILVLYLKIFQWEFVGFLSFGLLCELKCIIHFQSAILLMSIALSVFSFIRWWNRHIDTKYLSMTGFEIWTKASTSILRSWLTAFPKLSTSQILEPVNTDWFGKRLCRCD